MSITDWTWSVASCGGSGGHSASISLRFADPVYVTAQAAISAVGGSRPTAAVGFIGWVDNGRWTEIADESYGSLAPFIALEQATQVDFGARTYDGWVVGSAVFHIWS